MTNDPLAVSTPANKPDFGPTPQIKQVAFCEALAVYRRSVECSAVGRAHILHYVLAVIVDENSMSSGHMVVGEKDIGLGRAL